MADWKARYEELRTAVDDGGFADKRTDDQAHRDAMLRVERERRMLDLAHERLVMLGLAGGVLELLDEHRAVAALAARA
jgi:hypothetical protein